MTSAHQFLNPEDHRDLKVHAAAGAAFGDAVSGALTVPAEFRRLACDYPILFRYDSAQRQFTSLALFGFEENENLFLVGDHWDAACRPLSMAVQPFLVGRPRDGQGPSQVHVDISHPRIAGADEPVAHAVFDSEGRPTPYLEQVAAMLGALDEGYRASAAFYEALDRHELLEPFSMDVSQDGGATHRVVGYHLINEEKLRALEPAVIAALHADGHLEPIYMALASLGNLGKLVRRKDRRAHG